MTNNMNNIDQGFSRATSSGAGVNRLLKSRSASRRTSSAYWCLGREVAHTLTWSSQVCDSKAQALCVYTFKHVHIYIYMYMYKYKLKRIFTKVCTSIHTICMSYSAHTRLVTYLFTCARVDKIFKVLVVAELRLADQVVELDQFARYQIRLH